METRIKRPTSVWVAQIVIFVFALVFSAPIVVALGALFGPNRQAGPMFSIVLVLIANVIFLALFIAAFWGMATRKPFGRWLGVGMLGLTFLLSIAGQVFRPEGPLEYAAYENETQRMSGILAQVLMSALFMLLLYYLAFGKKVAAFFGSVEATSTPPPAFED